ncbi:MAG: DUF2157 domain-containing protein, partial [Candidatus Omnitrophica bacterium]|nr:DUF2157 domain-containing protein [Candidatus Omnitrophota bacterium]
MIFSVLLLVLIFYWIGRATFWRHKKYHRWLQRQLPLWEERGLINPDQGNSILNLYKLHRAGLKKKMDAVKVLTLVGSVFIGLGVIFFVASNWQRIPGHLRTAALLLVSIATLYAGYTFSFKKEGFLQVGKSLVLLATLFWGGTVALIGQIYNIPV